MTNLARPQPQKAVSGAFGEARCKPFREPAVEGRGVLRRLKQKVAMGRQVKAKPSRHLPDASIFGHGPPSSSEAAFCQQTHPLATMAALRGGSVSGEPDRIVGKEGGPRFPAAGDGKLRRAAVSRRNKSADARKSAGILRRIEIPGDRDGWLA